MPDIMDIQSIVLLASPFLLLGLVLVLIGNKWCPYCSKQISRGARKCPYCQEWLKK